MNARFTADFSVFYDAVQKATVQLKGFEAESERVEKQLNKMGESFGGNAIKQQATLATKAIEDLGGATRLTAQEQARANAIIDEAIQKYAALGQQAPADVQKLHAELQALKPAHDEASKSAMALGDTLKEAFHDPVAAVSNLATEIGTDLAASLGVAGGLAVSFAAVLAAAAAAAFELAHNAAEVGGKLNDMSEKTGINAAMLSKMRACSAAVESKGRSCSLSSSRCDARI